LKTILKTFLLLSVILVACLSPREMAERSEIVTKTASPNREKNQINVEVDSSGNNYVFYSVNNSFLPYKLEVEFTQIANLDPATKYYRSIINPGRSRLFELKVRQKNLSTKYNYKYKYTMGNPDLSPDVDFPYLIPLSEIKKTSTNTINAGGFSPALFMVTEGDTIYSMRRGKVTSIPDGTTEVARLTPTSLEVYHRDGTLGAYYGKNMTTLVKPGEYVYPGQPVGVMNQRGMISINVYQFTNNHSGPIPIKYTADGTTLLTLEQIHGVVALHPADVIQKELSESELIKYQKGNLY
jgi:murein DD-endopeptidase MepM/ murein hydrolase activator NlpD